MPDNLVKTIEEHLKLKTSSNSNKTNKFQPNPHIVSSNRLNFIIDNVQPLVSTPIKQQLT